MVRPRESRAESVPAGRALRDVPALRRALLAHYDAHRREMPWRGETDPYRVWVSEVLLQQTRVETVRERWGTFVGAFPSVARLAAASEDEVLKAWEGLGYYARARNLRRAAQEVVARHGGRLPATAEALRELPGFGPYTAAAVASIAFGRAEAVVDGNVVRVVARLLGEGRDVRRSEVRRRIEAAAAALLDPARPGDWNQAVMDLGASLCAPRAPRCGECPLAPFCEGRASGRAPSLPRKRVKKPLPHHEIAVGLVWRAGRLLIGRRPAEGFLGGLYECPGGKREPGESLERTCEREVREETGLVVRAGGKVATVRQTYTHFRITLHAFHCRVLSGRLRARGTEALRFVRPADLDRYAFPRANRRVFEALAASGIPPILSRHRTAGFNEAMAQTYTFPIPAGAKAEDLIAKAKEAGRGKGIALVGDDKKGSFKGTADGSYEVVGESLVITVDKKPGFVPWGMIESALKGLFTPK